MFIENIYEIEGCTLSLSCLDAASGHTMDFDATVSRDTGAKEKVKAFLANKGISHFIIVDNVVYDKKRVDFGSEQVDNTLYMTQPNGKVYRWGKVGVSFIKIGSNSMVTCILSNSDAKPFNRREAFRIAVDQYGTVLWSGEEAPEKCMVMNISHNGVAILMNETKVTLGIGYPAEISWSETIVSDENKSQASHVYKVQAKLVRVQPRLDGSFVVGFKIPDEPAAVHDMIQKVQTSRGIVKEAEVSTAKKGVERVENWQTAKELAEMEK
ncbi:MAG: PilZ domain-containing protein [Lachnospiraceae bacterium]|nr:PilZ domain-containing protein [Lachnospiraceae bacterium]